MREAQANLEFWADRDPGRLREFLVTMWQIGLYEELDGDEAVLKLNALRDFRRRARLNPDEIAASQESATRVATLRRGSLRDYFSCCRWAALLVLKTAAAAAGRSPWAPWSPLAETARRDALAIVARLRSAFLTVRPRPGPARELWPALIVRSWPPTGPPLALTPALEAVMSR